MFDARVLLLGIASMTTAHAFAQVPAASPTATAAMGDCATPEHRALDFRIGSFNVKTYTGIQAGTNRVARLLGGCAIEDRWTGAVSGEGRGLTWFDADARRWRMVYVNEQGRSLDLAGVFAGDSLVLLGDNIGLDGRRGLQRLTWSPLPQGGVRQHWEISFDGGSSWQLVFDGRYTRLP
jgi:hypothetical protein